MEIKVINKSGEEIEKIKLKDSVFNATVNENLLQMAVRKYHNQLREGTATTKGKGDISGSNKKIYRQKGTGNARMGMRRSPIRRGGGNAFPKTMRDFTIKMNKRDKLMALLSALTTRFNDFVVLNELIIEKPSTKEISSLKRDLKLPQKALFVVKSPDRTLDLSVRNLQRTKWITQNYLNVYDLLYYDKIIFTKEAILELENKLEDRIAS